MPFEAPVTRAVFPDNSFPTVVGFGDAKQEKGRLVAWLPGCLVAQMLGCIVSQLGYAIYQEMEFEFIGAETVDFIFFDSMEYFSDQA